MLASSSGSASHLGMVSSMTTPPPYSVFTDCTLWDSHLGMVSAVATPLHILLFFVMYSPPVSRSNHCFIVWSLHENDLWFQAVSVYCQLSDLLPRTMPHLIVVVWNQSRFWNQGTLAAWFLQQLLTLAMYTSRLLFGGASAHHHHWVNWKHSTLWCVSF